tara:strand:- start:3090 stop:3461 length:372 start_codon:yes stop_codon:yes gene_type:complete
MCDLYNDNAIMFTKSFKYTPLNIPKSYKNFVNNEMKKQTEFYIKDPFKKNIDIEPLWPNDIIHPNPSDYVKSLLPNKKYNLKNNNICRFKGSDTSFYMFGKTHYPNMSISSDGYCLRSGFHLN